MLLKVLEAIENAEGPISMQDLSRQLDTNPAVLEQMLAFWIRKGHLIQDSYNPQSCPTSCKASSPGCHGCHISKNESFSSIRVIRPANDVK